MVHPYSQDLRERALNLINNGMSINRVSRLLKISRPTLHILARTIFNNRFNRA
ncbi:MAG: hypothetical protein F6K22_15930 [Okeania sp. SIO2F4]|uniref:IS630 transposase-related protein n=1 Tax=Okeania sp. SIO2F4 TaxID=2607790 RepID=UPI00142A0384|nr:hypothetical protein [Okeania sp. SIO2F4]